MRKLSALDLAFFLAESEGSPKHVAGLMLCKKPAGSSAEFAEKLVTELKSHDRPVEPFNLVINFVGLKGPHWERCEDFSVDDLRYVPGMKDTEFQMSAGRVMTTSMVMVNVFEAYVRNDVFLSDLDRQLVLNYDEQRTKITGFPGMKVGDVKEPNNNAGNWED